MTWAVSPYYPGRVHIVRLDSAMSLCRVPAYQRHPLRPPDMVLCPECAITFAAAALPVSLSPR
ncbi:MAG: hypothetical protein M3443_19565, partial [Actinomycetota bacterium]|nr:hypothetical protein [Actinomycetota bacterium]